MQDARQRRGAEVSSAFDRGSAAPAGDRGTKNLEASHTEACVALTLTLLYLAVSGSRSLRDNLEAYILEWGCLCGFKQLNTSWNSSLHPGTAHYILEQLITSWNSSLHPGTAHYILEQLIT
jgi:hypothetical protein